MKLKIHILQFSLSLLLSLAACAAPGTPAPVSNADLPVSSQPAVTRSSETAAVQPGSEYHVIDALERVVTLKAPPQRIAVTGKALIMILDAAYVFPEARSRIAALGNAAQGNANFIALIDADYSQKASLQQDAGAEQIAAAHPDLVILKSSLAETLGKPLEALGIPVIFVDFETPEQYVRDLQILGQVFQNEARAEEMLSYYRDRVDKIQASLSGVTERPRTLLLYYTDRDGEVAFNVPPINWMQTRLVELAGGEPVWLAANPGQGWAKVSLEQIAAWDADRILIVSYSQDPSEVVAVLKEDAQWQALRAVQQGHLQAFAGDVYSWDQPDARWILGLSWLAGRLHPERFPGLDMRQQAGDFYQELYGLDQAFFDQNIFPLFKGDLP